MGQRDRKRRAKAAKVAASAARDGTLPYRQKHRDVFGGAWFDGEGEGRRFVVSFVDDLTAHSEALAEFGLSLKVVSARFTEDELTGIVDDVMDATLAFDAECFDYAEIDTAANKVILGAVTQDAERLEALITERFGDRVEFSVRNAD